MSTGNRYTLAEYAQVAGLKGVQLEVVHTIEDTEPLFASAPIIKCNSGKSTKLRSSRSTRLARPAATTWA